jgi:hypothetical protein
MLERERPALGTFPVIDPRQRWRGKIEGRLPPLVEDRGDQIGVSVNVGTAADLRCEVHDRQLNPGVVVARLLGAASGSIALQNVSVYKMDSVQDAPVLIASALYATRSEPPLAGELKIAVSPRAPFSVVCVQDEPGYRAAFARGVEAFLESLETAAPPRPPQYMALWQLRAGENLTGYAWDRIYAEPDGSMSSFRFDTSLAQLASGEVRIEDAVVADVHDRAGITQSNLLSYRGTNKLHELRVARAGRTKYNYAGELRGKAVEGSLTPEAPLASRYEALVKLRQHQSSPGPRVFQQQEYRPELNVSAATRVSYALDANLSTLSIQEGKETTTWSLKDGLPTGSQKTVGPNIFVGQVLTQRSALGRRFGLTHGMKPVPAAGSPWPLLEQRRGILTQISGEPTPAAAQAPPAPQFLRVSHAAPLGQNVAYVSPPRAGAKRAAIIWLGASLDFDVSEKAWAAAPRTNDPSARAFRDAGLVLMLPTLRGAHGNPGRHECFFGEVDDVIAAGEYLATREDVDPGRVYLGGHGAGGTLALLVASSSDRFAAVFAFGPAADVREYGIVGAGGCLPEGASEKEALLRAPAMFVSGIRSPTYVFEGGVNNSSAVLDVLRENASASVRFEIVPGADFQSLLGPGTQAIAKAIASQQVDDLHLRIDP